LKTIQRLILPFLFFYILSYPLNIITQAWSHRAICDFDGLCIFDIFKITEGADYLRVNVPLWFLLCLFVVQALYYGLRKLPDAAIFFIGLACIALEPVFNSIPMPFMINNAFYWLGYFALGNVIGKRVLSLFQNKACRIDLALCSSSICAACHTWPSSGYAAVIIGNIGSLSLILCLFGLATYLEKAKGTGFLRFFGKNTLLILCCHMWLVKPLNIITYDIFHAFNEFIGAGITLCVMADLVFPIMWCNRHLPLLVGKRRSEQAKGQA